ncbi:MAG: outer membrane protein assembly factor BamA [Spirochaetes bacterium]|nr:outer membrane protein assembly factor BamA [Spirochaetota bacterium]MBU0953818.1 outer membrane protein assembly factor BamA [Spirochaetota bacterium]
MKRFLLLSVLAALFVTLLPAQQTDDWYIGKPIRSIRFEGLVAVASTDLDPFIKKYRDQSFTEDLWIEILTEVYALDYFSEISPEARPGDPQNQSVIIVFNVTERPSIERINIEGNKGLRASELLEVISITENTIFNETSLRMDELSIRRLYLEKGYPEINVRYRFEENDNRVQVFFIVNEGSRVTLDSIQFEGINQVSASALKGEMKLKVRGLFQQGAFSEAQLQTDRESIETLYKTRGMLDARITDIRREVELDPKSGIRRLSLTFVIDEGQRYLYDGVSFVGNKIFDTPTLEAFFTLNKGAVFNYSRFLAAKARMEDLYYENGYIFNEINLTENRDAERGLISYTFSIIERDRAHVESIQVRGNTKTQDEVILREIPLEPGDVFSKAKILDAMRNLYNLQYFASVEPELAPGSQDLLMDLVFNVEEQSTAEVQFGVTLAGLGSTRGSSLPISGILNWNEKNFMGRGQGLKVDMNIAAETQSLAFGFTENWLFDRRWSAGVNLSFKHSTNYTLQDSIAPIFSWDDPARVPDPYSSMVEYLAANKYVPTDYYMIYDTWSLELSLNSGYTFKTRLGDFGLGGAYSISLNNKVYNDDLYRPFDRNVIENLNKWIPSNQISIRGYYNNLDLWYDPSSGLYASQRFSLTGFLPELELYKQMRSDTRLEGYFTLLNLPLSFIPVLEDYRFKMVAAAHSSLSVLLPWFDGQMIPLDYLRIDGTFIGRGWGNSTLSPQTGTALWSSWFELRWPAVPGILSLDSFFDAAVLAGTVDGAGALYNIDGLVDDTSPLGTTTAGSIFTPKANNFAFSFGAGLRFTLPQFPFRIYFAKPFYFDSTAGSLKFTKPAFSDWEFVLSISQQLN